MKRYFLLFLLVSFSAYPAQSTAGLLWVEIGVNGLTCSACTLSVEKSISKLAFVESVEMNLEQTKGKVYLKKNASFDLNELAKAVVDAGFSVRFLHLVINLDRIVVRSDGSFTYQDHVFQWMEFKGISKKEVTLKLIDAEFLPKKDYKHWKEKFNLPTKNKQLFYVVQEN